MIKIMIGIPSIRHNQDFWDSMDKFLPVMNVKYKIEVIEVNNNLVDEARTRIVDFFLSKDYDYLLFLDDDHSGHTIDMVESMLDANEFICAIKCYTKEFPYWSTLMNYSGFDNPRMKYSPLDFKEGYYYCDLVGFGMTLIKKEIFSKIDRPYFVAKDNQAEDNYFCEKVKISGMQPVGCFNHVLTHNGINETNAEKLNEEERIRIKARLKEENPEINIDNILIIA